MHTPIYLILILVLLSSSCSVSDSEESEPELPPIELPPPGSRNYTWTVDSVYSAPGGWLNDIWGSSPDNLWTGSTGGINRLWKYNGTEWKAWLNNGTFFLGDVETIFGFSGRDIWIGSNEGNMFHYNGRDWSVAVKQPMSKHYCWTA